MLQLAADQQVTLVAMAPSGEVFLVRDAGVLWLVSPPGAGGPERVDEDAVEVAVAQHGFELIDERFDGWEALDAERQRRAGLDAPAIALDVASFDATDVVRVLGIAERWQAAGSVERPRRVAHRLLEAPAARADDELYARLTLLLRRLDESPVPARPVLVDEPHHAARQRIQLAS